MYISYATIIMYYFIHNIKYDYIMFNDMTLQADCRRLPPDSTTSEFYDVGLTFQSSSSLSVIATVMIIEPLHMIRLPVTVSSSGTGSILPYSPMLF